MRHMDRPTRAFVPILWRQIVVLAVVVLALLAAALAGALTSGRESHFAIFVGFCTYLLLVSLPVLGRASALGVFHPLVFYVLWTGLGSLLRGEVALAVSGLGMHVALGNMTQHELDLAVSKAFFVEALALIGLYAGYSAVRHFSVPRWRGIVPGVVLGPFAAAWQVLPVVSLVSLAEKAGGLDKLLLQRGVSSDQRLAAVIGEHWHFLASVGFVAPLYWLAARPQASRSPGFWLVTAIALASSFAATGSRSDVVVPLIMLGIVWSLRVGRIPYRMVVIGVLTVVLVVGFLGSFRVATRGANSLSSLEFDGDLSTSMSQGIAELGSGATSNNGAIAVMARVPDQVGHLWGRSYASIPFIFVPSAVWPDKPKAVGKLNAELVYERPLTGIPVGPVGEAYWNFSYPGPVLLFFLFGLALRWVRDFYVRNHGQPLVVSAFAMTLLLFAFGSNELYNYVHGLVPLLVFHLFASVAGRRLAFHSVRDGRRLSQIGRQGA